MAKKTLHQIESIGELFLQAKKGNSIAENLFLSIIHEKFLVFAKYKLWDQFAAEDLAEDARLTVYQKYKDLPDDTFIEAWCHGVLRNKLGNIIKRPKKEIHVSDVKMDQFQQVEDDAALETTQDRFNRLVRIIIDLKSRGIFGKDCMRVFWAIHRGKKPKQMLDYFPDWTIERLYGRIHQCKEIIRFHSMKEGLS